jgi:streptogramin lyase
VAGATFAVLVGTGAGLDGPQASAQTAYSEYSLVASGPGPAAIAAGPDGNVWFAVPGAARAIGRITTGGSLTLFSQGLSSPPNAITGGPDGNVWFTELPGGNGNHTGAVGWITPSGAINETNAGLVTNLQPTGIVAGPDGNLWVTESGGAGAFLVRLSPTGAYQDFTATALLGAQASQPTAGPDGNVWFVLAGGAYGNTGAIGRITPAGTITVFAAGLTPNGQLAGLSSGPNGDLWFTQSDNNNGGVGSITPTGAITELPTSTFTHTKPLGIAAAADGNLYVSESAGGGAVVQVTPSGTVTPIVSAPSGHPGAITAQPGADVWFAETSQNGLGRVHIVIPAGTSGSTGPTPTTGTTGTTGKSGSTAPTGATNTTPRTLLAPPVLGVSAEAHPHGFVLARTTPGGPLRQLSGPADLPIGSFIDARSGTVSLTMAMSNNRTQTVAVGHGRFTIAQPRSKHGLTYLNLAGGSFAACAAHATTNAHLARVARKTAKSTHVVRQLWSKDNHGQFQTHGHNSVATVRGTEWITEDRCDGTLTHVLHGSVTVRPHGTRRTITITAGHSYLAPA